MDKADRKIAAEVLSGQGSLGYHLVHELYRVAHHQRDGLTDKEYSFLMARYKAIELELKKLMKLEGRLRHNGRTHR